MCVCVYVKAGLHDGTILVFNVSIASTEPVMDSWSVIARHIVNYNNHVCYYVKLITSRE